MGNYRLEKKERLTRKKVIESLFNKGDSFSVFPLKVLFTVLEATDGSTKVLVSVPTRNFPKATDRNKLKRRIREGYRLNKGRLPASTRFALAYIYVGREVLPSSTIHQAIQTSLERLKRHEKKD